MAELPPTQAGLPNTIFFEKDSLLSFDAHPTDNILACGTMQGEIEMYSHSETGTKQLQVFQPLQDCCRAVRFAKSGQKLYCGSKDKILTALDCTTGTPVLNIKNAHNASIYVIHCISERLIASGDEDGTVKIWDTRAVKAVGRLKENSDYISDMASVSEMQSLLVTSGDGSLSCVDLRQKKLEERSDCSESELLCVAAMKGGKKVVCGNGDGVLGLFNWGLWGDVTDRFPCHPRSQSVDSCIKINESVLCTGSMDGKIRSMHILPNKVTSIVGKHSSGFPVDNLRLNNDRTLLISSSYDCIKFWDVSEIPTLWSELVQTGRLNCQDMDSNSGHNNKDEEEEEDERPRKSKRKKRKRRWQNVVGENHTKKVNDFFSDL